MNSKAKKVALVGMLCAVSYVIVALIQIPIMIISPTFTLDYEGKDVIIAIGGFMFGPATSLIISIVVSFIEMVTISSTGFIGFFMNVLSSCGFAFTATVIYKKIHTLKGAIIGLISGALVSTALMLLWNYVMTPIFMGVPRDVVAGMLVPTFLPFNLLKNSINAIITLLIYKPIVRGLRKANILETK